jgi:hypothetical protein
MNMKIKDTEYGREEASEPEKPSILAPLRLLQHP